MPHSSCPSTREAQSEFGEIHMISVNVDKCLHCGGCVGSCPKNAIFLNDFVLEFNEDCIDCGRCVKLCPVGALTKV